jgi:hypothetical protein
MDTQTALQYRLMPAFVGTARPSTAQRMSGRFDPEPTIAGRKLKRGLAPLVVGPEFVMRNKGAINGLLRSGSIKLEQRLDADKGWESVPTIDKLVLTAPNAAPVRGLLKDVAMIDELQSIDVPAARAEGEAQPFPVEQTPHAVLEHSADQTQGRGTRRRKGKDLTQDPLPNEG